MESVEKSEFLETIALFSSDNDKAAKEVRIYRDSSDELSLWTDGFHLDTRKARASVA